MKRTLTLCAALGAVTLACVLAWAQNDPPPCQSPTINSGPASQTPCPGGNASFTVGASGTAPLSYQWRTNGVNLTNSTHISGATTATLTITNVTTSDVANYSVVVTNSCPGSVTSSDATLTILDTDGDGLPDCLDAEPTVYDHSAPTFTITAPSEGSVF